MEFTFCTPKSLFIAPRFLHAPLYSTIFPCGLTEQDYLSHVLYSYVQAHSLIWASKPILLLTLPFSARAPCFLWVSRPRLLFTPHPHLFRIFHRLLDPNLFLIKIIIIIIKRYYY